MRKALPAVGLSALVILVLLAGAYSLFMGCLVRPAGEVAVTAERVCDMLVQYITTHQGEFPASEEELLSSKLLIKDVSDVDGRGYTEYYYNFEMLDPNTCQGAIGSRLYWFSSLTVAYGVQMSGITEAQGQLYDTTSGMPLLLIDGPYKKGLGDDFYHALSLRLYEAMQAQMPDGGSPEN